MNTTPTQERILLLQHPGFIDRFIACVFEEAQMPLGMTINWQTTELQKAKRFDPAHAAEQAERYAAALGKPYRVTVCKLVKRVVDDYEECR